MSKYEYDKMSISEENHKTKEKINKKFINSDESLKKSKLHNIYIIFGVIIVVAIIIFIAVYFSTKRR